MKCAHCGRRQRRNPLEILASAIGAGCMLLLVSNWKAEPGYWADALWVMWWLHAILTPILAVIFLISVGEWLADPKKYYECDRSAA